MSAADGQACVTADYSAGPEPLEGRLELWDSGEIIRSHRMSGRAEGNSRVLLAEDNPVDQISIRRLLEKEGIAVTMVGDGRQAVDIFECGRFDFVLMDILMPDMDGFEASLRIREIERRSLTRIPLIALTSYSLMAVYDKCKSVGMSGYLSKPISYSNLHRLLAVLFPDIHIQAP